MVLGTADSNDVDFSLPPQTHQTHLGSRTLLSQIASMKHLKSIFVFQEKFAAECSQKPVSIKCQLPAKNRMQIDGRAYMLLRLNYSDNTANSYT